jgi:uncharacterized protein YkwD
MRNLHQLAVWRQTRGLVAVWSRSHVLVAGFLLALVWGAAAAGQEIGGDGASVAEQYLLSAANEERSALNLPALHRDPELARAAVGHAREMAMRGTISHQFAGEAELSARAAGTGLRFSVVSENVGEAPSALQLHAMWMHSAEHRANLLDPAVNAAGISVILRRGELYAVEDFAKRFRRSAWIGRRLRSLRWWRRGVRWPSILALRASRLRGGRAVLRRDTRVRESRGL